MRVLTAAQHRQLDAATLAAESIDGRQLMERAATAWTERFVQRYPQREQPIVVYAGSGNNGGDGLVIARLLRAADYTVTVIHAQIGTPSPDNRYHAKRAHDSGVPLRPLAEGDPLPSLARGSRVIDALFGTGLSRPVTAYWSTLIDHLNEAEVERIAVDLPSGLRADGPVTGSIVRAHRTLSLGYPKPVLFAPSATPYLGAWELVPFALDEAFVAALPEVDSPQLLTAASVKPLLRPRHANDHKGTFGHALVVAGAYGKMGAAIICARAVLRAGAGLVTTHLPRSGYQIMQIAFPEAMCSIDTHRYHFTEVNGVQKYAVVAVGPGIGQAKATGAGLLALLEATGAPMVLDADALNLIAEHPAWRTHIPPGSILTPHPREFERLFGKAEDDFHRWAVQQKMARELGVYLLLKTGYTTIATPAGQLLYNSTGNPGMATGGTGDALTGILTGLLAQGYPAGEAARLGVYLHGLAGDMAAYELGQESLLAEDVVSHLGKAFIRLRST